MKRGSSSQGLVKCDVIKSRSSNQEQVWRHEERVFKPRAGQVWCQKLKEFSVMSETEELQVRSWSRMTLQVDSTKVPFRRDVTRCGGSNQIWSHQLCPGYRMSGNNLNKHDLNNRGPKVGSQWRLELKWFFVSSHDVIHINISDHWLTLHQ